MKSFGAKESEVLSIKCWMTTEGMWLYHCLFEGDTGRVNKIDVGAIRSMGMKRVKAEQEIIDVIWGIFGPCNISSDSFKEVFPPKDIFSWDPERRMCIFDNTMKGRGVTGGCRCDLFCGLERWFDTLEVDYTTVPSRHECMVVDGGNCFREYIFKRLFEEN